MFNNNTSYQEAINAPSRRITGNVTIKGQKLSNDISSIDYVSSISGNTLTIGATNASTVDIKFKKLIEGLEERELIKVSFSVQTSSGIVERQIGEFFLTEIKLDRNNKTTTLKAIDKMAFLNDKYSSALLYPTLGRNIVQEIANSCNLRVNNNLNITNLPSFSKKLEKVTYREMLGYLAQTVGAFVIFNNNGELEFRKLNRTQKQISKGSYLLKGLEVDEVEYRINGISISLNNQEKTILAVGSPLGTQVKLTNPLMTQGWLNSIFSEYSKLRFNPFKLNWRGDPFVEVGDWISIEIANGSYRAFPILELKLSYSGGLKSTIGANVKGTTTSTTEYKGTVERQIEFINARLGASGNYVYADTVEPTNPKEGDTWFKPNGAFTDLYIYENNQWVLKTSTGNIEGLITKITDSSVSTQNLAAAIAKIIELDAARITTGSLSFEQLSSNTVSEIRKGMVSETKFNSFVNDSNGLRQQMSSEIERVVESKKSTLKGQDGTSSYIHRKYSDNANGTPMSDNSNLKYLGIYTGSSATPPTTPTSYTWSKIKGEDGRQGVPGVRGADGRTSYLHTAYANSPTGDVDFSTTNSNGKEYIGTYSDFEINDSNDYRKYKWMKIKGENGQNGRDGRDGLDGNVELNLLNGTKDFLKSSFAPPDNFQKNLVWNDESEKYEDFTVKSTIYQFNGLWQNVKVEQGKTYEFGFYAKGSRDTDKILFSPGWASSSAKQPLAQYNVNSVPFKLTTAWKFYSFRFTVTQTGWSQCRVEKNEVNNGIKFSLCGLYLKEIKNNQSAPLGWSPSIEDLQGRTLTANLRFEGTYINNITNNVKAYLDVFYDGQKVSSGFNVQVKVKGGLITEWSNFWNANVDNTGRITNLDWGNREQNGTPLEVIVLVNYKGLNTVANARMENLPDIVEIKEITKKYKTFESTIDQFNSTIGEVKQQVLANEEKRNLILGSRMISDKDYTNINNADITTSQEYEGLPFLSIFSTGNTSNVWKGVGFNLSIEKIKRFETYTIKVPIFISDDFKPDEGAYLEIKNHDTGESLWNTRLDLAPFKLGRWNVHEYIFQATKDMNLSKKSFYIYIVKNGYLAFAKPHMCEGTVAPKNYSPAPEDVYLQNSRIESSIKQTKDEIDLKVSKDNVIASINASVETNQQGQNRGVVRIKGDAITDYLYGKTIEGAIIKGNSQIKIGEHGYMRPSGDGLRFCLPEKPNAKKGVGIQMLGNYGREGNSAYGLYVYVDPNFDTTETASTNSYLMTVNGYIKTTGINNLKFQSYTDGSTGIGVWNKNVELLFDNADNDIYYSWGDKKYSLWKIIKKHYDVTSDIRLKKDIKNCEYKALEKIDLFNFKSFNWVYREDFGQKSYTEIGLIAQEVEEISENFVTMAGEYKTLDQFNLLTFSLKAIQELSTENQQLKSQLNEMNERLQKLEDKINGNI